MTDLAGTLARGVIYGAAVSALWIAGPTALAAFSRLDTSEKAWTATAITAAALLVGLALPSRPHVVERATSSPTGIAVLSSEDTGFRRWVEAQASPGEDVEALARRLRPTWDQWLKSNRLSDKDRARHEAAHAVTAWALGHTIIGAEILPARNRGGCVEYVPPLPSRGKGPDLWDHLTIAVAANVLDQTEGRRHDGAQDDVRAAEEHAAALISTGFVPDGIDGPLAITQAVSAARNRAQRIVAGHPGQVDTLARALVKRRALTGQEVREILAPQEAHDGGAAS
ncbi:MAG: hypothetical protein Q4C85_07290 [Actinomyces sp.]|uniref:hypothetical protein n=1 Tax=Actinomyces sp. TaxID=29317 RepID=UPI0026DC2902|nr:hypothetical protein [Actinomyces sp.]MDO4243547.1 hypothetical protein [Actinomyces sp.]